jgi:ribosomal protein S18 acetylase RimI-like enzyme
LKLQKISAEEIPSVRKLAKEIWNEHYIKILSQAQIDYMLDLFYSKAKIKSELEEGIVWEILIENEKPIGYLVCKIESEKVYISKIYLKVETRGKGLGKILLNRAVEIAKENNKKSIYLNVNKLNSDSIAFYKRNGFQKIDEGVFEIGNGFVMDDFILELDISRQA